MIVVTQKLFGYILYVIAAIWFFYTCYILRLDIVAWRDMHTDNIFFFTVLIYFVGKNALTALISFFAYRLTHDY